MDFKESRNWWPVYTNHSVITSRPWSQEVRGFSMSLNLLTFKVIQSAVWWLFSQHKSTDATDLLDNVFALFLFPVTCFPSFSFFYFSLQSSEQKQAPVSSRASLPVQSQTRTTVSTLWFSSPHSWSLSDSPPSFCFPFCAAFDVLRDPFENTTMVSEVLSWSRVQVSRQVTQCRSVLLSRVEKGSECQMCAFVWVCLILRGESVPAVNVLLGLVWNFYSGILSFPRV